MSLLLIALIVLAPTVCQGHYHKAALGGERDEAGHSLSSTYIPPHFHAHHVWFLEFFDADDDVPDSPDSSDDHDLLPGQPIAAIFTGQAIPASDQVDSQPLLLLLGAAEALHWVTVPTARALSPPGRFIPPSDRPIYLSLLTLRI